MLTPGNKKLGGALIWGFGLPSGRPDVCVGLSAPCQQHCYARHVERLRPGVLSRYERNLRLSRLRDFPRRVRYFILAHEVAVVRIHTGGDFYDARYARKWLRVLERLPAVRFYFYTRSWRDDAIRPVLEPMAGLPNCRAWYSCDRGTGIPASVPPGVRLAWLMTAPDDAPPRDVHLTFRVRYLRRRPQTAHPRRARLPGGGRRGAEGARHLRPLPAVLADAAAGVAPASPPFVDPDTVTKRRPPRCGTSRPGARRFDGREWRITERRQVAGCFAARMNGRFVHRTRYECPRRPHRRGRGPGHPRERFG